MYVVFYFRHLFATRNQYDMTYIASDIHIHSLEYNLLKKYISVLLSQYSLVKAHLIQIHHCRCSYGLSHYAYVYSNLWILDLKIIFLIAPKSSIQSIWSVLNLFDYLSLSYYIDR